MREMTYQLGYVRAIYAASNAILRHAGKSYAYRAGLAAALECLRTPIFPSAGVPSRALQKLVYKAVRARILREWFYAVGLSGSDWEAGLRCNGLLNDHVYIVAPRYLIGNEALIAIGRRPGFKKFLREPVVAS